MDYDPNTHYIHLMIHLMTEIWHSPFWPHFTYDRDSVAPHLFSVAEALGEIGGMHAGLALADAEDLQLTRIVREAMASFGIEGVPLDETQIEASVIASLKHRDQSVITRRPDAIVALMQAARQVEGPLSEETLFEWHRLLFFGIELEDKGRWRRFDIEIVRSASAGRQDVLYKAPPPERVAEEMVALLAWMNAPSDLPVPVQAALAHLWFESIHPFSDGNGRIGRALVDHVFAQSKALPFALSGQIERDKKAYYAALQAGRQEGRGGIDATPFVIWFLQTIARAAEMAREEAEFLLRRNRYLAEVSDRLTERQIKVLRMLFAQGPDRVAQGVSAKSYAKMAKVSGATATRDLGAMERAGALERSEAGGRSTTYSVRF